MKIQFRIFMIFAVIFFASFIPENFHEFFGDWLCQGSGTRLSDSYLYSGCNHLQAGYHLPEWHWGFRHYVWLVMGATLALYNAVMLISEEDKNK